MMALAKTVKPNGIIRHSSSRLSIVEKQDELVIVYKWQEEGVRVLIMWWVLTVMVTTVIANLFRIDVTAILQHPGIIMIAVFVMYVGTVSSFNKTRTLITDRTIKIRRGPLPCLWPGNHSGEIGDVGEVYYGRRFGGESKNRSQYCVFLIFKNGKQMTLFTIVEQEPVVVLLASYIQNFIKKKHPESTDSKLVRRKVVRSATVPPTGAQKVQIAVIFVGVLLVVAGLAWSAELIKARLQSHQPKVSRPPDSSRGHFN